MKTLSDAPIGDQVRDPFDALEKEQQEELSQILEQYLVGVEQGKCPDVDAMIEQHPEYAEQLRLYIKSIDFLHNAAGDLEASTEPERSAVHRELGEFSIIREIGRGGMGVVYEATQKSLGRRVALKVLPFAAVLDKRQIARFQNEAQAAAQLHHPNIVPVHSVGVDRGVHYYSMQYIDGQSLDQAIEQLLQWTDEPATISNKPDVTTAIVATFTTHRSARSDSYIRSATELIVQAAHALDHAHSFGIVHRDIKPSNLLLDSDGKLWVADFGLARCQSNSRITMTGDMVGTLRYMSPEAAAGRSALVDHLTDIYSLGVTLYELLTLKPMFADVDRALLIDSIRNKEPSLPRKLNPGIPQDLETIVCKATSKSRDERYESAKEFAEDLQRFLDGKPTLAKRPGVIDRVSKWAVRHKRFVSSAAGLLVLTTIAATLAVATLQHEKSKTVSALAIAKSNYRQSQANLGKAIEVVDRFGMRVANQLVGIPGAQHVRHEILKETLADYKQLAMQFEDDNEMSLELASCNTQIASMHRALGELELAQKHLLRSISLYDSLERTRHNSPFMLDQAVAHNNLAELQFKLGKLDVAEQNYQKTLKLLGTIQQADDGKRDQIESATMVNLGNLYRSAGQHDEAVTIYRRALDMQEALCQSDPTNKDLMRECAVSYAQLAFLNADRDLSLADDLNQRAIKIHKRLVADEPTDLVALSDLSTCYNHRGSIFQRQGHPQEAQEAYKQAIAVQKDIVLRAPEVLRFREQLAVAHNNLAQLLCGQQQTKADAEKHFREAEALLIELVASSPGAPQYVAQLGGVLGNLAPLLEKKDPGAANALFTKAIEYQQASLKMAPKVADFRSWLDASYRNYVGFLRRQAEYDRAGEVTLDLGRLWATDCEQQFQMAIELAEIADSVAGESEASLRWRNHAVVHLNRAIEMGLANQKSKLNHLALNRLKTHPDFPQQAGHE